MSLSHAEAMDIIFGASSLTTLSYEEAIAVYLRARGILNDGEKVLGAPIPKHWKPRVVVALASEGQSDPTQGGDRG